MELAVNSDYEKALNEQKLEVRNLVLAGLEQIKEGKIKGIDEVCERLEKKYRDGAI